MVQQHLSGNKMYTYEQFKNLDKQKPETIEDELEHTIDSQLMKGNLSFNVKVDYEPYINKVLRKYMKNGWFVMVKVINSQVSTNGWGSDPMTWGQNGFVYKTSNSSVPTYNKQIVLIFEGVE